MILRRLSRHVKDQNWFAVGLDFLIVGVGVFIGIQMSNWNAARADVRRGAEFTEQLTTDLRMEAWSYARLIEYHRVVLAEAERAVGALEGKHELTDEAWLISAYRATQYINHQRSIATYEELTSMRSMGSRPSSRTKASRPPFGDQRGRESIPGPRVNRAAVPVSRSSCQSQPRAAKATGYARVGAAVASPGSPAAGQLTRQVTVRR